MFYNQRIDVPLSLVHNTSAWGVSVIGRLNRETEGSIYIKEIPTHQRTSPFAWRVVDTCWSHEDTTMTRFRAFGKDGRPEPFAAFGVTWQGVPTIISGVFKFSPEAGNNYYVPVDNQFHTPNTGGYTVCVLDTEYPSEGLAFGMNKTGKQHKSLVVTFRLFEMLAGYPNDLELEAR